MSAFDVGFGILAVMYIGGFWWLGMLAKVTLTKTEKMVIGCLVFYAVLVIVVTIVGEVK